MALRSLTNFDDLKTILKEIVSEKCLIYMYALTEAFKDKQIESIEITYDNKDFDIFKPRQTNVGYKKTFIVRRPEGLLNSTTHFEIIVMKQLKEESNESNDSTDDLMKAFETTRKILIDSEKIIKISYNWNFYKADLINDAKEKE